MLSVGRGYDPDYLLKEVATGRENYYTGAVADGEPPGRWWGAGAEILGLHGEVDAQDMTAVYARFLDPREDGFSDPSRWDEVFTLGHGGRAYKSAEQLYAEAVEREPHAGAERRDELRVEASKAVRQNVTFLDLTFSVQKSVTLLHTAFEAEEVKARAAGLEDEAAEWGRLRETVERAIWRGNDTALSYLQDHAGYARVGHHGGAAGRWIDAQNWVVASFFQHDSRDHDPQLHIHNATLNRQEGADGVWRTLDSRAIHRLRPAAAAVGERTTDETLVSELGLTMAMRPDGLAREATAVDPASREMFSSRAQKISGRAAELIAEFEASRGREATGLERDRIKRQATMATRAAKSHQGETREAFLDRVDSELRAEVTGGLTGIAHAARSAGDARDSQCPQPERWDADQVVADAVDALQQKGASFTHAELMREINSLLPGTLGVSDGADVVKLLHGLADRGVALVEDIDATVVGEHMLPEALRRRDGSSVYSAPGGPSYVTSEHLRSENRLRVGTTARDGAALAPSQARAFLAALRAEGVELGVDQAAAVTGILTSRARLETLIGPAGTGKSFTIGALARAWTDPHNRPAGSPGGRVFGLATAQVAAEVLAAEGLTATNTARWLAAQRRLDSAAATGRAPHDGDAGWRLRREDVLVVDESSMVDTAALAAVHAYAHEAGAKLVLVGDPRQLAAVGAGGAMDLVAAAGARYELADARRFTAGWERDASLRLRAGDPDVIKDYHRHGRLLDAGSLEQAEASATRAWLADTLAGRRSLLVVDTNDAAARCSETIRAELVRLGRVAERGHPLRDHTLAGVGDVVQGRRVAWNLAGYEGNRRGPVNRERYRVLAVREDGALEVEVLDRGDHVLAPNPDTEAGEVAELAARTGARERLVLPPEYVANDTTLAYAATVHAVEGATVDTSHTVATAGTTVNALYTGGSRGKEANTFHVATVTAPHDPAQGSDEHAVRRDPRAVLAAILETRDAVDDAHRSATAAREDAATWAASAQTGAERFADAAHEAATERTIRWLDDLTAHEVLGPNDRARIAAEDGTAALTRLLRQTELAGHDPRQVLHDAIVDREFGGARRVSDVLLGRIRDMDSFEPITERWADRVPTDIPHTWAEYLHTVAAAVDGRTITLGAQAADDPPAWALEVLGPVPDATTDPSGHQQWSARAGAIAAHREAHDLRSDDVTAPAAGSDGMQHRRSTGSVELLGLAPGLNQPEAFCAYRAAHRASGLPQYSREANETSPAGHRANIRAWQDAQSWGPAYVENMLAGTRQAEAHHRHTVQLRGAEAAAAVTEQERDQLGREAGHAASLADTLAEHAGRLEAAAETYGQWSARHAVTRAKAEESLAALAQQGIDPEPDHHVTAEEWLAAERAARAEDDPYRPVTETDFRDESHPTDNSEDGQDGTGALATDAQASEAGPDEAGRTEHAASDGPGARKDATWPEPVDPALLDEDTVHAPEPAEVDRVDARALQAAARIREYEALEARLEAEERAEQLAAWSEIDEADREATGVAEDDDLTDDDHHEPTGYEAAVPSATYPAAQS